MGWWSPSSATTGRAVDHRCRPRRSASAPAWSWPRTTRWARTARTRGGSTPRSSAMTTSPSTASRTPPTNTDIFLTYSDDDGRTWSTPVEVNDDSSDADGSPVANESFNPNDEVTGRSQYQPEIAVDPTTGTLVLSWRDARNDPANTLVATYITSQHRRRQHLQRPGLRQPRSHGHRRDHRPDGRPGPGGRQRDAADNAANATYGFGTSMGLAVYDGQVYPVWAGNFDEASIVNNVPAGNALSIYVPADGHRGRAADHQQHHGADPAAPRPPERQGELHGDLRPADQPARRPPHPSPPPTSRSSTTIPPTATPRSRSRCSASRRSLPAALAPATSSATPSSRSPSDATLQPGGGLQRHHELHRHLQLPDHARRRKRQPDRGADPVVCHHRRPPAGHRAGRVDARCPCGSRPRARAAPAPRDDITTSTLAIAGYQQPAHHRDHGQPVADPPERQRPDDHPDGPRRSDRVGLPGHHRPAPLTFNNQPFKVNGLDGSRVNGTYTLTIDDTQANNIGDADRLVGHDRLDAADPGAPDRRPDGPERRRHDRREPADDARRLHGPDPGRRLRGAHAPADGAARSRSPTAQQSSSARRSTRTPCR